MTRLLVLPVVLLVAVVGLSAIGIFGNAPGALMAGLMCAAPLFMFTLGWCVGRASNEFTLVRKSRVEVSSTNTRMRRSGVQEPLS